MVRFRATQPIQPKHKQDTSRTLNELLPPLPADEQAEHDRDLEAVRNAETAGWLACHDGKPLGETTSENVAPARSVKIRPEFMIRMSLVSYLPIAGI